MSATQLLLGVWLGAVGGAYMLYGRKQGAPLPLVCGVLLLIVPYLLKGTVIQVLVGMVLAAIPWIRR